MPGDKQVLNKKKGKAIRFTSFLLMLGKGVVVYLATIGQAVAMAQGIRGASQQKSNLKNLPIPDNYPQVPRVQTLSRDIRSYNQQHFFAGQSQNDLTIQFNRGLKTYQAIYPPPMMTEMGIQISPQQNGMRYERKSVSHLRNDSEALQRIFNNRQLSTLCRKRALSDPYYSLLMSDAYLHAALTYSHRMAEIFLLQAMLQAKTSEEINITKQAHIKLSKLDLSDELRQSLLAYRESLISHYSVSYPGVCKDIHEGGAIFTRGSDPELFECQAIALKMDNATTQEYLRRNPTVLSRLENEAVEKQNEYATGTLALIAMSSRDYILGLVLDIQRVLQYRKSQSVIRLYQFALRRLEQLLESPDIDPQDVEMITKISILEPYFKQKSLTENEKVVLKKYANILEFVKNKTSHTQKNLGLVKNRTSHTLKNNVVNGGVFAYVVSLLAIFSTLLIFFRLRSSSSTKIDEAPEQLRKGYKKKNGSYSKWADQSSSGTYVISSQGKSIDSPEPIQALHKRLIKKLKFFSGISADLAMIKKILLIEQNKNKSDSEFLRLRVEELKVIQPKNQAEYLQVRQAEKSLNQQMTSTRSLLDSKQAILGAIDKFLSLVAESTVIDHSIDNVNALHSLVTNMAKLYVILSNVRKDIQFELEKEYAIKQEKYQATIKMLDFTKDKAVKEVPSIVNEVSQKLNDLKLFSEEYQVKIDFKGLEKAYNNLLDALSALSQLVHFNYHGIDAIKLDLYAAKVVEAERVLYHDHCLRIAFVTSYEMAQDLIKVPSLRL